MMQVLKKSGIILLVILILSVTVFAQDINIVINGNTIETEDKPYIKEGRTLVPIRLISENLGIKIDWDGDNREVLLNKGNDSIRLPIMKDYYYLNGEMIKTEISGEITNSRTFVPVRLIAELFGSKVDWNNDTRTVLISDSNALTPVVEPQANEEQQQEQPKLPSNASTSKEPAYLYANGRIIGNKNSHKFHVPSGRDYNKVLLKNAVFFNSTQEATAAGYVQAKQ